MTRPADGLAIEMAVRSSELDGGGEFGAGGLPGQD